MLVFAHLLKRGENKIQVIQVIMYSKHQMSLCPQCSVKNHKKKTSSSTAVDLKINLGPRNIEYELLGLGEMIEGDFADMQYSQSCHHSSTHGMNFGEIFVTGNSF